MAPRAGRDLELVVARLETLSGMGGFEVRSPEFVVGRISDSRRELDVTLRGQLGSLELFVMFECRDRDSASDVSWIEQIASKRDDVGANLAVAVHSRGFSSGARRAARRYGVELRTVERLSRDSLEWWSHAVVNYDYLTIPSPEVALVQYETEAQFTEKTREFLATGNPNVDCFGVVDIAASRLVGWFTAGELSDYYCEMLSQEEPARRGDCVFEFAQSPDRPLNIVLEGEGDTVLWLESLSIGGTLTPVTGSARAKSIHRQMASKGIETSLVEFDYFQVNSTWHKLFISLGDASDSVKLKLETEGPVRDLLREFAPPLPIVGSETLQSSAPSGVGNFPAIRATVREAQAEEVEFEARPLRINTCRCKVCRTRGAGEWAT